MGNRKKRAARRAAKHAMRALKGTEMMHQVTGPVAPSVVRVDLANVQSMIDIFHATGDDLPKEEEITKPLSLVLTPKGVTEIRAYPNYHVIRRPEGKVSVQLMHMLPWSLYAQIVGLFKKVAATMNNAEALVYVWQKEGKLCLTVPEQTVSGTSANPSQTAIDAPGEGWQLWGHIHSHNTMNAFFSGTDDSSEKQDGLLYGVIGKVTQQHPESKWRLRANGIWLELNFDHLVSIPRFPEPPDTWLAQIKPVTQTVGRGRFAGMDDDDDNWHGSFPRREPDVENGGYRSHDRRRLPAHTALPLTAMDSAFVRIIRLDGSVWTLWKSSGRLVPPTPEGGQAAQLTAREREFAYVEGIDWTPEGGLKQRGRS